MVKLIFPILLISFGILSDCIIFHRHINFQSMWRWFWWLPTAVIICFVLYFYFFGRGVAQEYTTVNIFLLLLGIFCIPKMLFVLFSCVPRIGVWLGLTAAIGIVMVILWGVTFGFSQLKVRHIVYESPYVPEAFDGYRIVQFSDAHTGTFRGVYHHLLRESVDSINALSPDLVCFVGDIENFSPEELLPHAEAYSSLRAVDGVIAIMGNHDYSTYVNASPRERAEKVRETRSLIRSFGWTLLENEHLVIPSAQDSAAGVGRNSIVVVGEENWGKRPFPQYGNLGKALKGLEIKGKRIMNDAGEPAFAVMLSHDPTAWKAHIRPVFHPDMTLSGHTHGTQFSAFGWSPASMVYEEWGGEYYSTDGNAPDHRQMLSVSTGFGGNFPFRFNMPREVVVITLKHKK